MGDLQEKLTGALIDKAKGQYKPNDDHLKELKEAYNKAESLHLKQYFKARMKQQPITIKKVKKMTASRIAYRVSKTLGNSPRVSSRIGLAFLAYSRGNIGFTELKERTLMSENDILSNYSEALNYVG